jgi:hypothetical protein
VSATDLSADGFIEEWETRFGGTDLITRVDVRLSPAGVGVVALDYVEVIATDAKGTGLASRVLRLLLELSDESGIALEVIPHSFGGPLDDAELAAWYGRHGFLSAPTTDTPRLMRRNPRPG